ncbi:MAG: hypothetical protein ACFFD2_23550 [Promethearchaeota archaeon]
MATPDIFSVVKEINSKMGSILGVRVYIAVTDGLGNVLYMDSELEQFQDFILNFVKINFKFLKIGEHSLPISGKNIMFFRYPRAIIVLYSSKGRVGQLLSFKSLMPKYKDYFDGLVGEVPVQPIPARMIVEEIPGKPGVIPTVPVVEVERAVFSRSESYYGEIYPIIAKKLKAGAKFSLTISIILNYSDGENSFQDIKEKVTMGQAELITEMYKLCKANMIKIPDFELFQVNCPSCKAMGYKFVPTALLKSSPNNYMRFQVSPLTCDHTFYVILDKKGKVKTNSIPKLRDISEKIDFSELFIEKLIEFFGQDVFFNIFHSIFFKYSVVFLESTNFAEQICEFIKNFFPQITYGNEIKSLTREDYLKSSKKYGDCLVIDLVSNIIANEPYETEDLDFELRLFRKVLQEKDIKVQILKTHSEFERLILLIDTLLTEIEMYKEIKEDELIKTMKMKHNITLERSEIPIIKELADIYYGVDIRKKITKTLVGKVSDFFDGI